MRVDAEPLLEDRGVDGAEVGRRDQVAVAVEAAGDAGELADLLAVDLRADQEPDPGRAVVGAGGGVLGGAAAELRPDLDQHAVGDPAGLEVALEGEQRVGGELEPAGRASPACVAWVSKCPGEVIVTTRIGSPAAIIAASPASRCGNGIGRDRVGDRACCSRR